MADKSCKTPRWRLLKSQLNNLSQQAFKEKLTNSNCIIVDVRTEQEYTSAHIIGAINIDYFSETLIEELRELDHSKEVLIYCRTGRRSIRVCTLMKNGGFDTEKIFNLEEGFSSWVNNYSEFTE